MSLAILIYQIVIAGIILYGFQKSKSLGNILTVGAVFWTLLNVWAFHL